MYLDNTTTVMEETSKEKSQQPKSNKVDGQLSLLDFEGLDNPVNKTKAEKSEFRKINKEKKMVEVEKHIEEVTSKIAERDSKTELPPNYSIVGENGREKLVKILESGETQEVGEPLYMLAHTRSINGDNWGRKLLWQDLDGKEHTYILSNEELCNQGKWYLPIVNGGWQGDHKALREYLLALTTDNRLLCTTKTGWHNQSYVLPTFSICAKDEAIEFQGSIANTLYTRCGTFQDWKDLSSLAKGNTRLEFAILCALGSVLLKPSGIESGGFHLDGCSSCGKSTALQLAASVWGGRHHVRQFRATSNALEKYAVSCNDNILILDEIGQVNAAALGESIYMLANQEGKARATSKHTDKWRLLFLTSGEIDVATKLQEGGMRVKAGQDIRLVSIPTSKEHISSLHKCADSAELVNEMKELSSKHYGFAGPVFITYIVKNYSKIQPAIRQEIEEIAKALCPGDAHGQVMRVALRFALLEYTRRLAIKAKILTKKFGTNAVESCFNDWFIEKNREQISEVDEVLSRIRLFIEKYGASRFQNLKSKTTEKISNRLGVRDNNQYYFFPESFKQEVLKGLNFNRACAILKENGWLICEDGRNQKRLFFEGQQQNFYLISIPEEN